VLNPRVSVPLIEGRWLVRRVDGTAGVDEREPPTEGLKPVRCGMSDGRGIKPGRSEGGATGLAPSAASVDGASADPPGTWGWADEAGGVPGRGLSIT
jgi:hypothetical protein